MKIRSLMAALLVGGMLASPAFAANSQQDKMKACNGGVPNVVEGWDGVV
ncbi:MAG: hypothetical protein GAK40_01166 [Burkholderia plantarii]|nr:MAG: hypothetical protein GAK40_01166 [Burkholderia plantarii]